MGQKFTYTQLVFGSIVFKLFNLGQTFHVAFHKLPTICWVNFGPIPPDRAVSGLYRPPCSHTLFQFCPQMFYRLEVRALWWPLNTLTLLCLSLFATTLEDHCPFGRPICDQALTSWLMSWDVASIYPHNCPSWCHLFCEVHQSLLQQRTLTSRLGWCSLACKPPPFSSKHNDGHYGQTVIFLFHQTRGHFSKKSDLCPHVQTIVWLFLMVVLEQWLLPCWAAFQVI